MGSWAVQPRKGVCSPGNPVVLVVLFLAFFYISLNVLQLSNTLYHNIHRAEDITKPAATTPAAPTLTCLPPLPPTNPIDDKKLAFLVETRPLPHLPALFVHMTALVPPEWKFKFMGSPEAIKHMKSNLMIRRLESNGKLDIIPLPSNYSLESRETISQMFTDIHLYRDILAPAENLLVFQPDSIFCANAPKTIDDFLHWDWIGAPWSAQAKYGGNGGLSLRKVSKVLQVLEKEHRRHGDGQLEDLWISDRLRRSPDAKMPAAGISKTFSVESVWDGTPLGYHIGWLGVHHSQIWDNEDQVKHIMEYCPEVKIVLGMKLDNDKPATVQAIDKEKAKGAEKEKQDEKEREEARKKGGKGSTGGPDEDSREGREGSER